MKEKENQKKEDATIILKHHVHSSSLGGIIKEFKDNESFRIYNRSSNTKLFHDIISFSPLDKTVITKTILQDLAEKYIELRGRDNLYLIVEHKEKDHIHLHAVVSGVKIDGYSSRISKQQFNHLKTELERFQQEKYPQLQASHINHNKTSIQAPEQLIAAIKNGRQTNKQKVAAALEKAFAMAQSKDEFIQQLNKHNYTPYYRNAKLQGVLVDDRKFRFSTLGYDEKKFIELDTRHAENTQIEELQMLRKGITRHIPKEHDAATKELRELEALRNERQLNQSQERVIDIDDCVLPEVSSMEYDQNFDNLNIEGEQLNLDE